jgi:hypothetical protein
MRKFDLRVSNWYIGRLRRRKFWKNMNQLSKQRRSNQGVISETLAGIYNRVNKLLLQFEYTPDQIDRLGSF